MRLSRTFGIGLCCLLLQGCQSDYKDIDRRQFIVMMSLDQADNGKFTLALKGVIPQLQNSGASSSTASFDIYKTTAASLGQAIQKVRQQLFLEPDYSHLKAVIFSEQFAERNDLTRYIDFFIRRRDFQDIAIVAISNNAEKVVSLHQEAERTTGDSVFMKFGEGANAEYNPIIQLQQVYKYSLTPGLTFYCPILNVSDDKVVSAGTALFGRDNRMKMKLTLLETKYFNLLRSGISRGFIILDPVKEYGIGIRLAKAEFRFKIEQDALLCDVHVKVQAQIEDSDVLDFSPSELQKLAKKKLDSDISSLLVKMQNNRVDPLQLGLKYWSKNPVRRLNNEWLTEDYPEMKFRVHSDVMITRTGTLRFNTDRG
ncbi:Ger(x)C family spore germination protein [Cohnella lupini]|uniref:Ger(X)C family germination protein n=1 Tax=Cohnella lupini TaxID=1294267 RepID=A0A3D9IV38_9BACL|nr:Ger(x)C family spore germination protein [Cohnella lupini]RED65640.1 Ger(x)C family germination protein [Cohnella lupini]